MRATPGRILVVSLLLLAGLALVCLVSLCLGPARLHPGQVLLELVGGTSGLDDMGRAILWRIRLPRVLLAVLVGGALATGGVVFQALLRNPLAEPFILGVSGGAAFGAIIALLLGWVLFGVAAMAFVGGAGTIALVMGIAAGSQRVHTNTLLLAGVIVNAFFSAAIMFVLALTKDQRVHNVLHWLMGNLGFATYRELALLAPLVLLAFGMLLFQARTLNLLVTGEESAMHLGVEVEWLKRLLLVVVSLMVSGAVALSGIIGFVGLIIPHLLRLLLGPDHRLLLPASLLFGGAFLVLSDLVARLATTGSELPVGVVTALCGGPFFIYLLRRRRG